MLKTMTRQLIFCAGFLPFCLVSMDNSSERFTSASIWNSINNCCAGQASMTGRSQLQEDIDNFRRSTKTELLIPNIPVIRNDQKLCIVQVTLVKKDRAIDQLNAAITMMSMAEERK